MSGERGWKRVRRIFDLPAAEDVDLEIQSHIDMRAQERRVWMKLKRVAKRNDSSGICPMSEVKW